MTTFWGVDSANPANARFANALLYDYVTQLAGGVPSFWGRYIGGRYSLTPMEVSFLHSKGCRILVVYNGTLNNPSSIQGGIAEGTADAQKAVLAAQQLAKLRLGLRVSTFPLLERHEGDQGASL